MKIAIVHDDFIQWGGAERVVDAMAEIWPNAPIYTSIYDPKVLPRGFDQSRLRVSFMQKILGIKSLYRQLFFLYPLAFEKFNFDEYDVVVSSTTRFAKSIITKPPTVHICYCNTPPRFLWLPREYFSTKKFNRLLKPFYSLFLAPLLSYLRVQDYASSQRVDEFIANSQNVAARIKKYYRRESRVIYPFVEMERFRGQAAGNRQQGTGSREQAAGNRGATLSSEPYFLIVSRLGGHKRVDLAIEAFNQLGWQLKIIGDGPERKKYEQLAKPNIEFLGQLPDREVAAYFRGCQAFIYPQEEDFGITALEAQAAGKPVIAYRAGGVLETIIEGVTGEFFYPQNSRALLEILTRIDLSKYKPEDCIQNAQTFSKHKFKETFKGFIDRKMHQ